MKRLQKPVLYWEEERLDPESAFRSRRCLEISGQDKREVEVDLVEEVEVQIVLNGEKVATLHALPGSLKELALGFLVCEGLASGLQDVVSIQEQSQAILCQTSHLGQPKMMDIEPIQSDLRMAPITILGVVDQLNSRSHLWRRTGATHISLISDQGGEILASAEDVSRSCAVDKAVGLALLEGVDLSRSALVTSCRLSGKIVAKAARAGFPILCSKSAPLESGVLLAEKVGLTLVAFARNPRIYVYTGAERIGSDLTQRGG